ncbi:hypothetical protein FA13DRAFT_1640282 [Coprinellus micaceus]|uniref:Uncharacterized protein n=1 Tax=Coprinellus micaceus TaxID=71717 RepID=A0A4Y7SMR0_COPMI|nr:hypothetical protein FA13DRAFT_1640282 [Coprinellus micaceus]
MFDLHAYQLLKTGDIIAIERGLGIRGHNALCPCRNCTMKGVRIASTGGTNYYIPLRLPTDGQQQQAHKEPSSSREPGSLPKRTHKTWVLTLTHMDAAGSGERERIGKENGLREWPIFTRVGSLDYAKSFPWDWMHLLLENIVPNLLDLWMGRFKGLDEGDGGYRIPDSIWGQIAQETEEATKTIPTEFVRVLKNITAHRSGFTAESYCFWFCYLFPVLLRNRFQQQKYYQHGCLLVKIMKCCLQFSITEKELDELEADIIEWVRKYERCVRSNYDLPLTLNGKEVDTVWYGRVMSIMAVDLPGDRNVYGKCAGKTHLLAVVQPCNTGQKDARKELVAYKDYAQPVAIDLNHITALVGRAKSRNQWHILDRFEDCALAAFDGHEERGEGVEDDGADWHIFEQ